MISCVNDDDDDVKIDEEWKSQNDNRFNQVASDGSYNSLSSQSGNGKIYWKNSSVITDSDENILKVTVSGTPEFTDTIVVRYEGWYFDKNNKKIIFDSTENISFRSDLLYKLGESSNPDPNKKPMQSPVKGLIDGWVTLLQDMKTGEEREVCIPQALAYGASGSSYQSSYTGNSYLIIPGYTTLWFNVKLLKIIQMKDLKD